MWIAVTDEQEEKRAIGREKVLRSFHKMIELLNRPRKTFVWRNDGEVLGILVLSEKAGWLWVDKEIENNAQCLDNLVVLLENKENAKNWDWIATSQTTAEILLEKNAAIFCKSDSMVSYVCKDPKFLSVKKGKVRLCTKEDSKWLTGWIEDYFREFYGVENIAIKDVFAVLGGDTYVLEDSGQKKSLCVVTSTAFDVARLNYVYTPLKERGQKFGSSLVSFVTRKLIEKGLTPSLYGKKSENNFVSLYEAVGFEPVEVLTVLVLHKKEE